VGECALGKLTGFRQEAQVVLQQSGMPEVGLGAALERFELVAQGEVYCRIDIVNQESATIVLSALPEFPLEIEPSRARQFVEAWRERARMQAQPYEVHAEQREV
jgi:hypothetical protein